MARLQASDEETKRIDEALASWRQGDVALEASSFFVHVGDSTLALTAAAAEATEGLSVLTTAVEGLVVLSQTCDVVRSCIDRPFIEVAPLVEVDEQTAQEIQRGYRPLYGIVPALRDKRLVADLDRAMTIEKSVLASWTRTAGWRSDEEIRAFARALARKRSRFAFPDDFTVLMSKLGSRIREKHDKQSDEGRGLRALREIRVAARPQWDAHDVELFFWFVRDHGEPSFEGKNWSDLLGAWLKLVPKSGRFTLIEGVVASLDDISAREYVESDALDLDLDHLSTRPSRSGRHTPPGWSLAKPWPEKRGSHAIALA